MARDEINVTISADDEASKVIGKVADKAEQLEKADPEVEISADDNASKVIESLRSDIRRLEDMVVELQIKADTSQAEDGFQRVKKAGEDVGTGVRRGADDARGGLRDIGDEADNSRSVLANMAGNATQDLGALGGVAGTAGVAIGQLAEYATEGNIALSGLIKTAGPMLAIAVAVSVITSKFAESKKKAEELKAANEGIVESIRAGEFAVAAEKLVDQYGDVFAAARELGVGAAAVTEVLTGQKDSYDILTGATEAQHDAAGALNLELIKARRAVLDENDAQLANLGIQGEVEAQLQRTTGNIELQSGAVETLADKTRDARDAANELLDAQMAAADANFALSQAQDSFSDATSATTAATWRQVAAQEAYNALPSQENAIALMEANEALSDAVRDEAGAAQTAAAAALRLAEEQAAANNRTATAEERTDALNDSLLESAKTATPAARAEIVKYIADINNISIERATAIVANADTEAAARELDELDNPRSTTLTINPLLKGSGVYQLTATPRGGVEAPPPVGINPLPMPTSTQNITVNLPRGTRPSDMIRAVENYSRRNGRLAGRR